MSHVTITKISTSTVDIKHILHIDDRNNSSHTFKIVYEDGSTTNFHSLHEASREQRDGAEIAIQRMASALGIPFVYDEV